MVTGGVVTEVVWLQSRLQSWCGYRAGVVTEVVWLQRFGYRVGMLQLVWLQKSAMAANFASKARRIVTLSTYL